MCFFPLLLYLSMSWNDEKCLIEDNSLLILHCSGEIAGNGRKKESQEEKQVAREFLFLREYVLHGFLIACPKEGIRHPYRGHSASFWLLQNPFSRGCCAQWAWESGWMRTGTCNRQRGFCFRVLTWNSAPFSSCHGPCSMLKGFAVRWVELPHLRSLKHTQALHLYLWVLWCTLVQSLALTQGLP